MNDSKHRIIESTAWGLLFLWIGAALLARFDWGVGLMGAGAIILGAQLWRSNAGLRIEGFSILLGSLFLVAGASSLLGLDIDLFPLLFILGGVLLLASAWKNRSQRNWIGAFIGLVFLAACGDDDPPRQQPGIVPSPVPSPTASPSPVPTLTACELAGGTVDSASCCLSTGDFPNLCNVGACGCGPDSSHTVLVCNCPEGTCWNGTTCE